MMEFKKYRPSANGDPGVRDALDRMERIKGLTGLFSKVDGPFSVSLNGPWGSGKTFFLKLWIDYLNSLDSEVHSIYFNAWEHDISDDPVIPFIAEIDELIKESKTFSDAKKTKWKSVRKAGSEMVASSVPAVMRATMTAFLGTKFADDVLGNFREAAKQIPDALESVAAYQIDAYRKNRQSIEKFRERLGDFASSVQKSHGNSYPLFFFIDELDRCRPTFAVSLLERIKHILSVPGIVFVIAIDQQQLAHAIKSLYGQEFDAEGYLNRFFEYRWDLPLADARQFWGTVDEGIQLSEALHVKTAGRVTLDNLMPIFEACFAILALSTREQIRCFEHLRLIVITASNRSQQMYVLRIVLICIRLKRPDIYRRISAAKFSQREMFQELGLLERQIHVDEDWCKIIIAALIISLHGRIHNPPGGFWTNIYTESFSKPGEIEDQFKELSKPINDWPDYRSFRKALFESVDLVFT